MKELLLNLFSGALESVGEIKLIEALQLLHDKNVEQYNAAVHGAMFLITGLKPIVDKSKTPIDNAILDSLEDAVRESAKRNGVALPSGEV